MSKNNENKLVPKFRFPEFQNDGKWVTKTIGEIFDSFSGGTPNTSEKNYYGGKIPFIRSAEINREKTELFLTEEGLKNSSAKFIKKGDLLVALYGANSGDSAISKIDGAINQAILCLQSEYSNAFTYNFLTLNKDWIVSKYIQGGQGNLSGDIVKSISIPFTIRQEQQKIAECLSSLDQLIKAECHKVDLLKDHKKGLLQNLFPREGETVPKFRFREFREIEKWEEKELGSFCLNLSSGRDKNVADGEYELYGSTGIIGRAENASYEGDFILVARVGANAGLLNKVKGKFGVTDNTLVIDLVKKDSINFIFYSLKSVGLNKLVFGSGQPLITGGQLKNFALLIPSSEQEQKKIGDTLSSIDELINAHTQKVEALRLQKKGLLQGLFPNIINEQ